MRRKSRIQAERDAAATNRAADSAALGTMAASMVLGVLLPHEVKATPDHAANSLRSDQEARYPTPTPPHGGNGNILPPSLHSSDASGLVGPHPSAVPPSHADHAAGASTLLQTHHDNPAPNGDGGHAPSAPLPDLSGAAPATDHLSIGHDALLPNSTDGAGVSTSMTNDVGSATNSMLSSLTQSLTQSVMHVVDHLSTTLSGITNSLDASLTTDINSAGDTVLHGSASTLDALHITELPLLHAGTSPTTLSASLSPLTADVLGAPNGGMSQTFGAPETLASMHPSALSFGDASNPIHIGFVGQALAPIDGHDSIPHANGSILHGFI